MSYSRVEPSLMSEVKLREASFDDYQSISSLGAQYGLRARSPEEWRHVWLNNPEYRRNEGWPIGWVLENENREVVGSIGNVPLACEFRGQRLTTATGRSWVVDTRYRSFATLLLDQFFDQDKVDLFLNTTVNQHAMEAYKCFESPPVPRGDWNRSVFWITHYPGFAQSALEARRSRFSPLLKYPLAASLRLRDALAGNHTGSNGARSNRAITVRLEQGFDERFDVFWDALRARNQQLLLGVRTREVLEWHFRFHLQKQQAYILTVSEGDKLMAYSVFYRKDKDEYGLKRVRLVDYQSLNDDAGLMAAMLERMLHICRDEKIHMLEDVGCSIDWGQAKACPTSHKRVLPSWLYYYKANRPHLVKDLSDAACWRPFLFDGDSSL